MEKKQTLQIDNIQKETKLNFLYLDLKNKNIKIELEVNLTSNGVNIPSSKKIIILKEEVYTQFLKDNQVFLNTLL